MKANSTPLEDSIAHWRENELAEWPQNASISSNECALCQAFPSSCDPCPVAKFTGQDECGGSPYFDAKDAFLSWQRSPVGSWPWLVARTEFRNAARAEREFLESLRARKLND